MNEVLNKVKHVHRGCYWHKGQYYTPAGEKVLLDCIPADQYIAFRDAAGVDRHYILARRVQMMPLYDELAADADDPYMREYFAGTKADIEKMFKELA